MWCSDFRGGPCTFASWASNGTGGRKMRGGYCLVLDPHLYGLVWNKRSATALGEDHRDCVSAGAWPSPLGSVRKGVALAFPTSNKIAKYQTGGSQRTQPSTTAPPQRVKVTKSSPPAADGSVRRLGISYLILQIPHGPTKGAHALPLRAGEAGAPSSRPFGFST